MTPPEPVRHLHVPVAIIGGGFSGAAVAWHLARLRPDLERIVVIEPRTEIGRGLAYSTTDPNHRINVPATRMSLAPDMPHHFDDWLEASGRLDADPTARQNDGRNFPARKVFGDYVVEQLAALGSRLLHARARALVVEPAEAGFRVHMSNGSAVTAGIVVLAVAHAAPNPPTALAHALSGHPRFIPDPWRTGALALVRPDDRVLIVGTGLTMADIVASLNDLGHRGSIVAISRRGLRSRGHASVQHDPYGDFVSLPARRVSELVRRVRETVRAAEAEGKSWQCVFDQIRLQGRIIWGALPLAERARLVRHLRPFWDVHRFRIAPQVEQTLDCRIAQGTLELHAASLGEVTVQDDGVIQVALRHRRTTRMTMEAFDAVITATGPAHGRVFADNPVLGALRRGGLARPDPLRLGIEVAADGRAIDADGLPRDGLYVAGPLARGTIGELMGLPDVTNYAITIAETVAARLPLGPPGSAPASDSA